MGTQVPSAKNGNHENSDLMRAMGSTTGQYDPLPPDQRIWQGGADEPPKYRIWAWMTAHTIAAGRRSPYAVGEKGAVLTIKHLAADLDMDLGNAYAHFKAGARAGLWRFGTPAEGKERLYLKARVLPVDSAETSHSDEFQTFPSSEIVCTNNFPAFISKKTKDWDSKDREVFTSRWVALSELEKRVNAAVMAASREVMRTLEDGLLTEYGFATGRQSYRKNGETEQAAAERRRRVEPLLPAIRGIVETFQESVQNAGKIPTEAFSESVQTTVSLLSLHSLEGLEGGGGGGMGEGVGGGGASVSPPSPPQPMMPPPPPNPIPQEESKIPNLGAEDTPPASGDDDGDGGQTAAIGPTFEQEVETVRLSLSRFGAADSAGARKLVRDCRRLARGCTPAEIIAFIDRKAERFQSGRVDNPVGFLIAAVPDLFEGDYQRVLAESPPGPPGMSPEVRRMREGAELFRALRKRGMV